MNDSKKMINEDEMSHKGKKLRSYLAKMKVEAVNYAEINSNSAAGRKCAVDKNRICEWRKNKNKTTSLMSMKKRQLRKWLDRAGGKSLSENFEKIIIDWIIFRRSKNLYEYRES